MEKTLYRFKGGRNGGTPYAGLINVNGTLYGTTYVGGEHGCGTVFSITSTGTQRVLHSFGSGTDGCEPQGALVNVHGTLYGTTQFGGKVACYGLGCGTVFGITTAGKERVLYDFGAFPDGNQPVAGVLELKGTLYGTTATGGSGQGCGSSGGCGTVFGVTTAGKERVLHSFAGGFSNDGATPIAGLVEVDGMLYGTTEGGGSGQGSYGGGGTVFSLTTSGQERILHSFAGSPDGAAPEARLTYLDGKFYGTTCGGGAANVGTIFSVTMAGDERIRYSFGGGSIVCPAGAVTAIKRALYGVTYQGGSHNWGTVYRLKP